MLRVLWAVKRAYWSSWAGSRRAVRSEKMVPKRTRRLLTPARLEVLHLLELHGSMSQKALRVALGVVKSTVSETLAMMEKLGLVSRSRRTRSGRKVSPTREGLDVCADAWGIREDVDRSVMSVFTSDALELAFEEACHGVRRVFGELTPRLLFEHLSEDD